MSDEDDFDLDDELERELEAGMDVDEDEGKEPSAVPGTDASADVPSAALPAEPQLAEGQPSAAVAGGGAEADGGREHAEEDEERQLEARKQERQRKNTEVIKLLTDEQLDRYEAFRRSKLARPNMRKLLHSVTGQAPHVNTTIVMCGIAKLFVGDVVETARMVAAEEGDTGPLRPEHLQAAYQRLDREGKIPHRSKKRRRPSVL